MQIGYKKDNRSDEEVRYIIANEKCYIKSATQTTNNLQQAKIFVDFRVAERFKKSIKKTIIRNGNWQIVNISLDQSGKIERNAIAPIKVTNNVKIFEEKDKSLEIAKELKESYNQLLALKVELENRINDLESEQQDLLHFCEFYDLSGVQGFKFYKSLQKIRVQRRNCKDELARVKALLKTSYADDNVVEFSINAKKSYSPRICIGLFNNEYRLHEPCSDDYNEIEI